MNGGGVFMIMDQRGGDAKKKKKKPQKKLKKKQMRAAVLPAATRRRRGIFVSFVNCYSCTLARLTVACCRSRTNVNVPENFRNSDQFAQI